jgi:hypothetical protein
MAKTYLPDESHIVRHLSPKDFDTDNGVVTVFPHAFELRLGEEYLSASWLEFFSGPFIDCIAAVAAAISRTRDVRASHAFAIGNVKIVKDACADYGLRIRVIHEPDIETHPAYVAVRQYRSDDLELLDLLARDAWSRSFNNLGPSLKRYGPWNAAR